MSIDFHLEEYKCLRSEVLDIVNRIQRYLYFQIIFSGLSAAWIFTQAIKLEDFQFCAALPRSFLLAGSSVPVLIAVIGAIVIRILVTEVRAIGRYIYFIEDKYGADDLGWEHFLRNEKRIGPYFPWIMIFWLIFFFVSFSGSLFIYHQIDGLPTCRS